MKFRSGFILNQIGGLAVWFSQETIYYGGKWHHNKHAKTLK